MSGNTDNLGYNSQQQNLPTGYIPTPVQGPSGPIIDNDNKIKVGSKDTIESQSALIASLYLHNFQMSFPVIIPPTTEEFLAIQNIAMNKVCMSILDNWSKGLQEIADQKREEEKQADINPNPLHRDLHIAGGLITSIAMIFIHAIFGNTVAEALNKSDNLPPEAAHALRYATQLYQWSNEGVLNGYLKSIVDQLPSSKNLTAQGKEILSKQLEIMLLGSAVAALFKTDSKNGYISPERFNELMANPAEIKDPTLRALVYRLIDEFGVLGALSQTDKVKMEKTLGLYLETNPDLPSLLNLDESANIQLSILNNVQT